MLKKQPVYLFVDDHEWPYLFLTRTGRHPSSDSNSVSKCFETELEYSLPLEAALVLFQSFVLV